MKDSIPARISGYFGQLTKAAVIAFQKRIACPQTGYVGPLTLALLNKGEVPTTSESPVLPALVSRLRK